MSFEWLVALRYLRSPNRPAVLRLVTLLAAIGVTAGVTTLVIALAMNTGFRQAIRDRLLSVTAHVNLKPAGTEGISDYRALMARLSDTPGVRSINPAVYNTVLLSSGGRARGVVLKGVDPELERRNGGALRNMAAGSDDFAPQADGIESLLVGRILADELRISAGDYVTLTSPQGNLTPFGMLPRSRRFRVTGVFDSGFYDYDANWAFVTLASAQGLAGVGDVASLLEVRIANLDDANGIASDLLRRAGKGFTVTTWMDENEALFRALSLEKLVTALFIGLITFVAGLNILISLIMMVMEKTKDIAVLMSMGTRRAQVRNLFIAQGVLIGVIGTAIGLVVGYAISYAGGHYHVLALSPEVYSIDYVPFAPRMIDGVWVALFAVLISFVATLYPSWSAARILPAEALRYE